MLSSVTVISVLFLCILETFGEKNSTNLGLHCHSGNVLKSQLCKGNNPVTHCYYTKTIPETTLTFQPIQKFPTYNYSCDFTGICEHYNVTDNVFTQIPWDYGKNGTTQIYCCNGNNCNKPTVPDHRQCYNAYKTDNISEGTVEQCSDSDSHCVQITGHNKNRTKKFEYFSCDANLGTLCRDGNSSQVHCFNVSLKGTPIELCCCYGDFCLVPTFNYTKMDTVLFLNETALYLIENEQKAHTPSPENYTDWLFVGGLIATGVLILLIIIVAVTIAVKCRKKKKANKMYLEYTRVRADSTPDDEEDVRMLLS